MGFFGRTSKRSGRVRLGALAMAAAIALACSYFDDDESGSSSASLLEGTWKGTLRVASESSPNWDDAVCTSPPPCLRNLQVNLAADSLITDVLIRNESTLLYESTGYTGTTSLVRDFTDQFAKFYDFELVHADEATVTGSFYIDDRFIEGMFIFSNGDFSVVEKRQAGLRPFPKSLLAFKMTETRRLGVFVRWTGVSEIAEVGDWEFATEDIDGDLNIPYSGMIGGDIIRRPGGGENEKSLRNGIPVEGKFTTHDRPGGVWEDALKPEPLVAMMTINRVFVGTMECENGFPECVFTFWKPIEDFRP
jgi:hypothetical protein